MRRRLLLLDGWSEVRFVAVIAAYVLLAIWADELAITDALTLWRPQAGLGVAAVAVWGPRFAIPIILAELGAAVALLDAPDGLSATLVAADAVAVGGAYVLTGLVIRRLGVDPELPDVSNIVRLLAILGVGAAPAAAAGVAIRRAADIIDGDVLDAFVTWLAADVIGMLSIAPAVIVAVSLRRHADRLQPRPPLRTMVGVVEIVAVVAVPIATVALLDRADLLYLSLIPVVAVALRRGQPGASLAAATTVATLATALRIAREEVPRRETILLLAATALIGLVLGLVVRRRFGATRTVDRLSEALERSDDVVALVSLSGEPRWWNDAAGRFLMDSEDRTTRPIDEVMLGGADMVERLAVHIADGRSWLGEHVFLSADGDEVPMSLTVVPDIDEHAEAVGYTLFARDISATLTHRDELTQQALHDRLTGVANRALLVEQLGAAASRLRRTRTQTALMLLDIDRFSVVNETLGREAGDELLRAAAGRLQAQLRPGDVLARLSGDEFAVLATGLDGQPAIDTMADAVLSTLRVPFVLAGGTVVATASLGVVRLDAGDSADEILRRADLAVYRAKADGGARAARYDDRLSRSDDRQLQIESTLRRTLTGADVPLEYQPVVDLRTGNIRFAEALLRIEHEELGPIPAPEALSVATTCGVLGELGLMIARTAAMEAATWPNSIGVSINLTTSQLTDEDLPHLLVEVLAETGLDPQRLIVELTEDAYLADPALTTAALHRCQRTGVRIALDGFGRGWSALAALRELPVDVLKLDQHLLGGLGASPQTRAIVGAILGIAEVLEFTVVAQGIESDEQLETSRSVGCQLGQGHRISRPLSNDGLDAWINVASPT